MRLVWFTSPLLLIIFYEQVYWIYGLCFALLINLFGQGMALHRYFCHKSFKTSKFWHYVMMASTIPVFLGSPLGWSHLHRHHHKYSDTEEDYISIEHKSWASMYFGSYLGTVEGISLVRDLIKDKVHMFVHKYYVLLWGIWALSVFLLFGFAGFLSFAILPIVWIYNTVFLGAILIHTATPFITYRNFNIKDKSVNNWLFSIISLGDGWHNNHHQKPSDWNHSRKWWEVDITSYLIKIIKD
jgi:stearoyl-CoA desaturase (delta-9 desaturase)